MFNVQCSMFIIMWVKLFPFNCWRYSVVYLVLCVGNKFKIVRVLVIRSFSISPLSFEFSQIVVLWLPEKRLLFLFRILFGSDFCLWLFWTAWNMKIFNLHKMLKDEKKYTDVQGNSNNNGNTIHENDLHHRYGSFKMNIFFNDFSFFFISFCFIFNWIVRMQTKLCSSLHD